MIHNKGKALTSGLVIQKVRMRMNDTEVEEAEHLGFAQWSRSNRLMKFYAVLKSHLVLENSLRLFLKSSPLAGHFVETSRMDRRSLVHEMTFDRNN